MKTENRSHLNYRKLEIMRILFACNKTLKGGSCFLSVLERRGLVGRGGGGGILLMLCF